MAGLQAPCLTAFAWGAFTDEHDLAAFLLYQNIARLGLNKITAGNALKLTENTYV